MLVRAANDTDANSIVQLVKDAFDPKILNAMTYGCCGIESYVRASCTLPRNVSDTLFYVADDGTQVVGCIELRLIGTTVFLNYICTHQGFRQKGLGKELLRKAIQLARTSSSSNMSLDVFYFNSIAKRWYEKLGFEIESSTAWWSIPLNSGGCAALGKISGLAHANVCQREFGFSQFSLHTSSSTYRIGRLGSDWFRVLEAKLLKDTEALSTLQELDPKRKLLGLFPETQEVQKIESASHLCRSARMTTSLDSLIQGLNPSS